MRILVCHPLPPEATEEHLFRNLIRLPESFEWQDQVHHIIVRLCPVAMRLARRTNWPLMRQCWHSEWGVAYACPLTLEDRK